MRSLRLNPKPLWLVSLYEEKIGKHTYPEEDYGRQYGVKKTQENKTSTSQGERPQEKPTCDTLILDF